MSDHSCYPTRYFPAGQFPSGTDSNDFTRKNVRAQESAGRRVPIRALTVVGHGNGHTFSTTHKSWQPALQPQWLASTLKLVGHADGIDYGAGGSSTQKYAVVLGIKSTVRWVLLDQCEPCTVDHLLNLRP